MRNRSVGSHRMNDYSSRSHTILTVNITSELQAEGSVFISKQGKINFVDLAGSEMTKKTNSEGKTLEEANNINKSLMVLGKIQIVDIFSRSKKFNVRFSLGRDKKRDQKKNHLIIIQFNFVNMNSVSQEISKLYKPSGETAYIYTESVLVLDIYCSFYLKLSISHGSERLQDAAPTLCVWVKHEGIRVCVESDCMHCKMWITVCDTDICSVTCTAFFGISRIHSLKIH